MVNWEVNWVVNDDAVNSVVKEVATNEAVVDDLGGVIVDSRVGRFSISPG